MAGAGGGVPDLGPFRAGFPETTQFAILVYPGWRRYVEIGFSLQTLIDDLVRQIEALVPEGPIRIIGISIGAHFGYAAAAQLQAAGRNISGFCAVDAFTVSSAATTGWLGRALKRGARLVRERRIVDLAKFLRSLFWRAMLRLSQEHLVGILRRAKPSGRLHRSLAVDPVLENELSMRFLIRLAAPGIAALDRNPIALNTSAVLLRTGLTARSDQSWQRRCPRLKIMQIPGNHETMLAPQNLPAFSKAFSDAARAWRFVT
ncbi:thioesterase domain-containing protein [Bradyrhizobium sp. USDA 4449]